MRVRESEITGENLPPISLHNEIFLGTALFALLTGIIFIIAGLKGKQYWIASGGVTLVFASVAYLVLVAFGFR